MGIKVQLNFKSLIELTVKGLDFNHRHFFRKNFEHASLKVALLSIMLVTCPDWTNMTIH